MPGVLVLSASGAIQARWYTIPDVYRRAYPIKGTLLMMADADLVKLLTSRVQITAPFSVMESAAERIMSLNVLLDFWKHRCKEMEERVRQHALLPEES